MKRISILLTAAFLFCLLLSVGAFASAEHSAVQPGTYSDGINTLVIADDMTFSMQKNGENMDGTAIAMVVSGIVNPDGSFTITSIKDGDLDVLFLATEDQLAGDQAAVEAAYAGGAAGSSAEPEGIRPGTYEANGNVLVIADDMTFSMQKNGENMDGGVFAMTIKGIANADGTFTITNIFDGELDVLFLATEDQIAGDLASVEETYAAATASGEPSAEPSGEPSGEIAPGSYTDGVNTLIIAEDMSFTMEKTGINLDGAEFVMLVTGTVENGEFVINGLFDGDINVFEMATEDQIAADLASVQSAYNG